MISQENAKLVLEGLRAIQYGTYTYTEFIKVLKKRIKRFTGRTEVMFLNERELVLELGRLGVLQAWHTLEQAGSK
jgi:hypothetical protein